MILCSVLFLFVAFLSLLASLIYLFKYCWCVRKSFQIWKRSSFYITVGLVIYDIISDILAAVKVYVHHDEKFFILSVLFTSITFFIYWLFALLMRDEADNKFVPKYLRWTLYFPVLSMITVAACFPGAGIVALIFLSFPQYIISLSFILEHRILDTFNVMAVVMSLFQILTSPLLTGSSAFFKIRDADTPDADKVDLLRINAFSPEASKKKDDELGTNPRSWATSGF